MEELTCRCCMYAGKVRDGRRNLLICVNCPLAPGKLTAVKPDGTCRNFHPRRKRAGRRKRPQPSADEIRYIALTKNHFAIVGRSNYKRLSRVKWHASLSGHRFYATHCTSSQATIYMHREIMRPPKGMVVDHMDANGVNNWRGNLRICTPLENGHNSRARGRTSHFKGVSYIFELRLWEASICDRKKMVHIGYYKTEIEAARAYDAEALKRFGQFAWLNFPNEPCRVNRKSALKPCQRARSRHPRPSAEGKRVRRSEGKSEPRRGHKTQRRPSRSSRRR